MDTAREQVAGDHATARGERLTQPIVTDNRFDSSRNLIWDDTRDYELDKPAGETGELA